MIKLQRGLKPEFWTRERVHEWTKAWLEKECKSDKWQWPQHEGKKLNQHAREAMVKWHYGKCAFCEKPLSDISEEQLSGVGDIEHFRPKTKYGEAAFIWRNLFWCCKECNQAKGEKSHVGCLKPDRDNPMDYLWIDPISRKIQPRPDISMEAQQRAHKTIEIYGLNRIELAMLYKHQLSSWIVEPIHSPSLGNELFLRQRLLPLLPKLETLAQPNQPFSLFIHSLVKYLTQNQT